MGGGNRRWRATGVAFAVVLAAAGAAPAAELQLRESVLRKHADSVTAEIRATVSHVGDHSHPLGDDCDLHVPLRSSAIRVPLLGEVKNACSIPTDAARRHWSRRIADDIGPSEVTAVGVFRIWHEHPPPKGGVQSESKKLPQYKNSNPDHMVELHPLIRIGSLDFVRHIGWIEKDGDRYEGYGYDKLRQIASRSLEIQRVSIGGERYVRMLTPKMFYNHWSLRAVVVGDVERLADGLRAVVDILPESGNRPPVRGLTAVVAEGTDAHGRFADLRPGQIIEFLAVGRIALRPVLAALGDSLRAIRMPVEFFVLDFEVAS
jgi:hypothetical protein